MKFSSLGAVLSGTNGYTAPGPTNPSGNAIDGSGNAWLTSGSNSIVKLSSPGVALSGTAGFTSTGLTRPYAIAVDGSGNSWASTLSGTESFYKLSNSGAFLSGANGHPVAGTSSAQSLAVDGSANIWATGPGNNLSRSSSSGVSLLTLSQDGPLSVAIDGARNAWSADISDTAVAGVSSLGSPISGVFGLNGATLTNPEYIALDGSGDIWVVNENSGSGLLSEIIGASVPVVAPLATGVKINSLRSRPQARTCRIHLRSTQLFTEVFGVGGAQEFVLFWNVRSPPTTPVVEAHLDI